MTQFVSSEPGTTKASNVAKFTPVTPPARVSGPAPVAKALAPTPAPSPRLEIGKPTGQVAAKVAANTTKEPVVEANPPPAPATVDSTLVKILSWKRKYESDHEVQFMLWLNMEVKARGGEPIIRTGGNLVCEVDRPDGKPTSVLFSCHTDTVHWLGKDEPRGQAIMYDSSFGHIFLDKKDPQAGNCLGADDGAGVWLMLEMIKEKVPGVYIFHRGEERGGVGSNAMLSKERDWLADFEIAVAFDRPGLHEIITHQGGLRCCSDKFATALAAQFEKHGGLKYVPSSKGVFTDTKVYRGVICECTNIGVGYFDQHHKDEYLDFGHLVRLRDACCKIDWEALPADRDPHAADPLPQYGSYKRKYSYGGYNGGLFSDHDDDADDKSWNAFKDAQAQAEKARDAKPAPAPATTPKSLGPALEIWQEIEGMSIDDLETWVLEDSRAAGIYLLELASEVAALKTKLKFLKESLQ